MRFNSWKILAFTLSICVMFEAPAVVAQSFPVEIFQRPAAPSPLEAFDGMIVGQVYCSGNHRTRDRIILQEVLLRSGEAFDSELARETMRNLRQFNYLGSARLIPHPDSEAATVDIEVAVSDSWPWVGAIIPTFAGGQQEAFLIFANGNFRGMGQATGLTAFLSNQVANSYSFFFDEPRIVGSRWSGSLRLGFQGEVGNQNRLEISRPLYSLSTPTAFDFAIFDESDELLLYDDGVTISDYYQQRKGGTAGALRSFREGSRRHELGVRYQFQDEAYDQAPGWNGVIAPDKKRATLMASASSERLRFVEDRYFNLMGPVEDLRLGIRASVRAGGAIEFLGSDRGYPQLGMGMRWFEGSPEIGYVLLQGDADSRVEGGQFTNTIVASAFRLYKRVPGHGMLAGNAEFTLLDKMEDPRQLLLGSPEGLRGYAANSFNGSRRFLSNLEWRWPFLKLGWVTVGSVVFADGGIIWSDRQPLDTAPFRVGAGGGVRLGFSGLLGAPVIRLDVGHGFAVGSTEFSFGFGQRF